MSKGGPSEDLCRFRVGWVPLKLHCSTAKAGLSFVFLIEQSLKPPAKGWGMCSELLFCFCSRDPLCALKSEPLTSSFPLAHMSLHMLLGPLLISSKLGATALWRWQRNHSREGLGAGLTGQACAPRTIQSPEWCLWYGKGKPTILLGPPAFLVAGWIS